MEMSYLSDLIFNSHIHRFFFSGVLLFLLLLTEFTSGQQKSAEYLKEAAEYLESRGEVFLLIPISEKTEISRLSKLVSIDGSDEDFVYVYASPKGFDSLISVNLTFRVETPPSMRIKSAPQEGAFPGEWNRYPSYYEYIAFIHNLATTYPEICRLDTIGLSINNREILVLKISDQVSKDEPEPEILLSAAIHGDEPGGYLLLLRFAEWLLNGYGKDLRLTDLVDQLEIWINPLSNPDGAYFLGDEDIFGAKRFNINNVDLNRNFPDPEEGLHPDGEAYQPETIAMMEFMRSRHFVLSASLHGGAELVNYPWDTWAKFHPDDAWYQFISRQYADTAHLFCSGYMTDMVNGITNGFAWYSIAGGRQDYVNYFLHQREVTLELSRDKIPVADTLLWFWECNHRSLYNYIEQSLFGITGTVTDRITGKSVRSKIEIPGHDSLNSYVWSDSITGGFSRMIKEGTYDLNISASGYKDTLISSVFVADFSTISLDIHLTPVYSGLAGNKDPLIQITNPFEDLLRISVTSVFEENIIIDLFDTGGRKVIPQHTINSVTGENIIIINGTSLSPGLYILKVASPAISYSSIVVKAQ